MNSPLFERRRDAIYSPQNIPAYLQCYESLGWLKAAVDYLGRGLSRPKLEVVDGNNKVLKEHALARLLNTFNPFDTYNSFLHRHIVHKKLGGNTFWHVVKDNAGIPRSIYLLTPSHVGITSDPKIRVKNYVFNDGSTEITVDASNVVHFREPHPYNDFWGMSPIQAIVRAINSAKAAETWNEKFFKNNATPETIITPKDEELNWRELKRVRESFEKSHQGEDKHGKMGILPYAMEIKQVGVSPKDIEYLEGQKWNREQISAVLGVPPILLGERDGISYNQSDAQLKVFWELTVIPELQDIVERINSRIAPLFDRAGVKARVRINESTVSYLTESADGRTNRVATLIDRGIISRNEARQALGFERKSDPLMDECFVPLNFVPISHADEAATGGNPANGVGGQTPGLGATGNSRSLVRTVFQKDHELEQGLIRGALQGVLAKQREALVTQLKMRRGLRTFFDPEKSAREIVEAIRPAIVQTAARAAEREMDRLRGIGIRKAIDDDLAHTDPRVARILESDGLFTDEMETELYRKMLTSQKSLLDRLKRAHENSEDVGSLVSAFEAEYDSPALVEGISTTETTNALNVGKVAGFKELGVNRHEWLTVGDSYVRDSHLAAESEGPVELGKLFASTSCRFPGDSGGPAEEVINCRCTTLPVLDSEVLERSYSKALRDALIEQGPHVSNGRVVGK